MFFFSVLGKKKDSYKIPFYDDNECFSNQYSRFVEHRNKFLPSKYALESTYKNTYVLSFSKTCENQISYGETYVSRLHVPAFYATHEKEKSQNRRKKCAKFNFDLLLQHSTRVQNQI